MKTLIYSLRPACLFTLHTAFYVLHCLFTLRSMSCTAYSHYVLCCWLGWQRFLRINTYIQKMLNTKPVKVSNFRFFNNLSIELLIKVRKTPKESNNTEI